MQYRMVRLGLILALLIVGLTALPMAASAAKGLTSDAQMPVALGEAPLSPGQTTPPGTVPTATPTATVAPFPTATPVHKPMRHKPMRSAATATPDTGVMRIGRYEIVEIFGNRLTSVLYAFTDNGWLHRSTNDGHSWKLVTSSPDVGDFMVTSVQADILYSGYGDDCETEAPELEPFYRSDNQGKGWQELAASAGLVPLLPSPKDSAELFAADCFQLYTSDDSGENWSMARNAALFWSGHQVVSMSDSPMTTPAQGGERMEAPHWGHLFAGAVDAEGTTLVASSTDKGLTWTGITPEGEIASFDLRVIVADPNDANRLWFADALGVWATEDGGAVWALINDGLGSVISHGDDEDGMINDLVYSSATGNLYLAAEDGLYMLADGETAWQPMNGEDFGHSVISSLVLTESEPTQLWINSEDGVFVYDIE